MSEMTLKQELRLFETRMSIHWTSVCVTVSSVVLTIMLRLTATQ